jgi:hypothetical protein
MKKLISIAALLVSTASFGQAVSIQNVLQGSGSPGMSGYETSLPVSNDYLHTPQFMDGFPTAATIWPRIIDVPCTKVDGVLKCQGYTWNPKMGRGEYLFIRPVVAEVTPPVVVPPVIVPPVIVVPEVPKQSVIEKPPIPVFVKPKPKKRKVIPAPVQCVNPNPVK